MSGILLLLASGFVRVGDQFDALIDKDDALDLQPGVQRRADEASRICLLEVAPPLRYLPGQGTAFHYLSNSFQPFPAPRADTANDHFAIDSVSYNCNLYR
jgi:hypothetical protein